MGNVEIPTAHHGFVPLKRLEVGKKAAIPILAVRQTTQILFGVRDVHGDHKETGKFRSNHPTLVVMAVHPDVGTNGQWRRF